MVRLTQTMHLSCTKISTIPKRTEPSLQPNHLEIPSGAPKTILSRWYVGRKLCTYLAQTQTLSLRGKKWDLTWRTSPRSSLGASKMIFEPMVRSTQTVHLSCIKISTILKGPKRASTWALLSGGTNEWFQNNFWACGTCSANHVPILYQY
jgi:hypothetical protein